MGLSNSTIYMTERAEMSEIDPAAHASLSDAEMEIVAEKAAEKAIQKLTSHVYEEVGRSVVSKLFYIVGAGAVGLYLWAKHQGLV